MPGHYGNQIKSFSMYLILNVWPLVIVQFQCTDQNSGTVYQTIYAVAMILIIFLYRLASIILTLKVSCNILPCVKCFWSVLYWKEHSWRYINMICYCYCLPWKRSKWLMYKGCHIVWGHHTMAWTLGTCCCTIWIFILFKCTLCWGNGARSRGSGQVLLGNSLQLGTWLQGPAARFKSRWEPPQYRSI